MSRRAGKLFWVLWWWLSRWERAKHSEHKIVISLLGITAKLELCGSQDQGIEGSTTQENCGEKDKRICF